MDKAGGIGLPSVLFIVFLILKLTEVINWSWWWVTAPLWIPAVVGLGFFVIGAMLVAVLERR